MPESVLHQRQNILVLASLSKDDPTGWETGLLETRGVQVETADHPQDAGVPRSRERRGDPGDKKRGGCVVTQRGGSWCNLVQGSAVQASVGQTFVDGADAERERRHGPKTHVHPALAQERHDLGFGTGSRHRRNRLICSPYVPLETPVRSRHIWERARPEACLKVFQHEEHCRFSRAGR